MEFDFGSGSALFAGAVVFPEWAYTDQPRAEPVTERVYLRGQRQPGLYATGTPDNPGD
jgi:hypothetical protein